MSEPSKREYTILAADPLGNLSAAFKWTFSDRYRIGQWFIGSSVLFVLLLLSTEPIFAFEMLLAGVGYWGQALDSLVKLLLAAETVFGLLAIGLYTVIGGVVLQHVYSKLRRLRVDSGAGILTLAPGVIAAGCASCGAGALSLLVGVGGIASLPMAGVTIRLLGVALFCHYLSLEGNPTICQAN